MYRAPARNPFWFGSRDVRDALPAGPAGSEPRDPAPAESMAPAPPAVTLSGVAEDRVGERVERTAVLSSPGGVLLVREGDEVLGQFRVASIERDAIELKRLTDGGSVRLTLRP